MFVRLTYFSLYPDKVEEAKRIFYEEVVPVVKQQRGNRNIMLLEPISDTDDFISFSSWDNIIDAHEYEASGKYKELINKAKATFSKDPVLRSFKVK